jgi:hypothetical protein
MPHEQNKSAHHGFGVLEQAAYGSILLAAQQQCVATKTNKPTRK